MLVDVVCPDGVGEGDLISIQHPEAPESSYDVAIPTGVGPGVTFQVELPEVQEQVAIPLPPEPPERRMPSVGLAIAVVAPMGVTEVQQKMGLPDGKLTPSVAEALHNIMESLFESPARSKPRLADAALAEEPDLPTLRPPRRDRYEALDAFIDENSAQFRTYQPEGEQRLEWTTMHHH